MGAETGRGMERERRGDLRYGTSEKRGGEE